MTPERFREIVATPGDAVALRPELTSLPLWKEAKGSVNMQYTDGRVFSEECTHTAKAIDGNYIVFTIDSKFYGRPVHAIRGYDEKASAIHTWSLFGDALVESTVNVDPVKKVFAETATYEGGFLEIVVGTYSDEEISERSLVYKNGVLFMTREAKTTPIVVEAEVDAE